MNKKTIGITDLPRDENTEDLLNLDSYAEGLLQFVANCTTPMSVALQGDWGSGKSSLLNYLQHHLDSQGIKTIFFNTWQYSQMAQGDRLAPIFINAVLDSMDLGSKSQIKKAVGVAALNLGRVAIRAVGGDANAVDALTNRAHDIQQIKTLRDDFERAIQDSIKLHGSGDRIVILVDDLDRLNPNVAVELLEIIKLFMDVKQCVFVLAIDYEVVVQGVKGKFGESISMDKCRSFFDKIVQLPFHMPVETYKVDQMIEAYLGDRFEKQHIDKISRFAELTVGANPRAIKRVTNSFILLEFIQKSLNQQAEQLKVNNALLFCILCIQTRHVTLYGFLADTETWLEQIKSEEISFKETEDLSVIEQALAAYAAERPTDKELTLLANILIELDDIFGHLFPPELSEMERYQQVADIINLSMVTSREHSHFKSAPVKHKDTKYRLILKNKDAMPNLSKRRLVLAVIENYVLDNPDATVKELQNTFPLALQGKIEVILEKEEAEKMNQGRSAKYYFDKSPLSLGDGTEIWVCNQWSHGNIDRFIGCAQELGYVAQAVN